MGIGKRITNTDHTEPSKPEVQKTFTSPQFINTAPRFMLDDLILSEQTNSSLLDFIAFKAHHDMIFSTWGLEETHKHDRQTSVNFYGPPGTGKTAAAHAVASSLDKEITLVNYADIESKYVGETSKNVTSLFEHANRTGSIIFFDEADAILSRRVANISSSTDVSVNQTRSVLLTLLDQHDGTVIFASNFLRNYDPAFMRRITSHIFFDLPEFISRKKLWRKFIPSKMPTDVDFDVLASESDGLSGAEISNCVIKSAVSVARRGKALVSMDDFRLAVRDVIRSKYANERPDDGMFVTEMRSVTEDYVAEAKGKRFVKEAKQ